MGATLEIFACAVRGGAEHHKLGDPYAWFLEARASTEEIGVVVLGPATDAPVKRRREIMQCRAPHFERVRWLERAGDTVRAVEFDLARYR